MNELSIIKEKLNLLADMSGQSPRRIHAEPDRHGSHIFTLTYVGNRDCHGPITRLVKNMLDAGLGENVKDGEIPRKEDIYNTLRHIAPDRPPVAIGNIAFRANTETMFTMSLTSSLPAADIAVKLQDAIDTAKRQEAHQGVEDYLRQLVGASFSPSSQRIASHATDSPTERVFTIDLENKSSFTTGQQFRRDVLHFMEVTEHLFGNTTPVKLTMESGNAAISITGNPTLLLDAIKAKDRLYSPAKTTLGK